MYCTAIVSICMSPSVLQLLYLIEKTELVISKSPRKVLLDEIKISGKKIILIKLNKIPWCKDW